MFVEERAKVQVQESKLEAELGALKAHVQSRLCVYSGNKQLSVSANQGTRQIKIFPATQTIPMHFQHSSNKAKRISLRGHVLIRPRISSLRSYAQGNTNLRAQDATQTTT